ncbi:hypothetical protein DUNSADRAFT_1689 [Dunaliella salina]|uniref:Response regulatory domain-containing protein n=1 Tax=Dunaliella salina TaxID=3046 RepID=A0ABQ7GWT8_DUNSA|nr:hypothetical protein DUNSADRAFT_1689 [Dunaliella salina]|eukprot:KAF5839072.1 hypothetical protein DUNSADRAFT_1689 [Dunaliella salina]
MGMNGLECAMRNFGVFLQVLLVVENQSCLSKMGINKMCHSQMGVNRMARCKAAEGGHLTPEKMIDVHHKNHNHGVLCCCYGLAAGLLEGAELLQEAQARLHSPESVSSPSPGEPGVAKTVIQSRVPVNPPFFPPVVNGTGAAKPSGEAAVAAKATLEAVAESMENSSEGAINSWGAQAAKPLHRHIHGSYQVMIVDDDVISQVVAEQVVRSQKWKAMKASSGEQCIEYLKHAEVLPDLLLLDNKMPGPTGFLVCQKLRATYPLSQLAIIMVSVRVEEGDAVQALQNGADDYVAKPYKRSELTARIMAQLRVRDNMASAAAAAPAAAKGANVVVGPRKPAPGSSGKRGEEEGSRLRLHHQGTERAGLPTTQPPPRALMFNNAMVVVLKLLGLEQRLPLLHATTSSPAPTSLLSLRAPGNSQAPSGPAVDATGHLPPSAGFGGMGVSSQESEPGVSIMQGSVMHGNG